MRRKPGLSLEQEICRDVKSVLSKSRFQHVIGVVEMAADLANCHGVDPEKAKMAGWLHDIAREWPLQRLLLEAEHVQIPSGFASIPLLLHGPIAAHIGKTTYGIVDEDVLNAVRFHTTGRLGMSVLEKILFIADATEPGRTYPGVDELRKLARQQLDAAMICCLDSTMTYLLKIRQPIFPLTVMVRNEYLQKIENNSKVHIQEEIE